MPIAFGDSLGPYQITGLLGVGGMGKVYRATDPRLRREVAIKVSSAALSDRFQREARAVAALNHPNICTLFDVGPDYLVMELVEGPTLAARIKEGPIPFDEAIVMARQIVDALEAAHEKGITHRDLKPANIKIRPDGTVKVLDFGLAKLTDPSPEPGSQPEDSPTLTLEAATRLGTIMGTAGYMSPEQARGKKVDKRTDIWAFGVVLYEMLMGRKLFQGEDASELLAAVIKETPNLDGVPVRVRRLLEKCLERDLRRRLRDIADVWLLLDETAPLTAPLPISPASSKRTLVFASAAAIGLIATGALSFVHFSEQPAAAEPVRFEIHAPQQTSIAGFRVSPDGRRLALTTRELGGPERLWIRDFNSIELKQLASGSNIRSPLWSPDGRFVAYLESGQFKKVEASGGPAQSISIGSMGQLSGGLITAWSPDGLILVSSGSAGIRKVPESGGALTAVAAGVNPVLLPDGKRFLYQTAGDSGPAIHIGSIDAPEGPGPTSSAPLITGRVGRVEYAVSEDPSQGYILFLKGGVLFVHRFDHQRQKLIGREFPVAESVQAASATRDVLVYRTGDVSPPMSRLIWRDRAGNQLGTIGQPGPYGNVELSADGRILVVDRYDGGSHLWNVDISRGAFSRLIPGGGFEYAAAASRDGMVAFTFMPAGVLGDVYAAPISGAGAPELWVKSDTVKHPNDFSPDGKFLMYDDHTAAQAQDLYIVPAKTPAGSTRKPVPFLATPADETSARFSPDGKWVSYSSDESGRREVYVRDFTPDRVPASGSGKWLISTAGGDKPNWRRDGKEIFYISPEGKMMAVPVKAASTFEPGIPVPLFDVRVTGFDPYAVGPDGRFLINTPEAATEVVTSAPLTVVLNWQAALKKQ